MKSEPARLGGISLFHMNTCKWVSPARWDRVFLITFAFFHMLVKYCENIIYSNPSALHEITELLPWFVSHGFTSLFIVKRPKNTSNRFTLRAQNGLFEKWDPRPENRDPEVDFQQVFSAFFETWRLWIISCALCVYVYFVW